MTSKATKPICDDCRIAPNMPTSINTIRSSVTAHINASAARRTQYLPPRAYQVRPSSGSTGISRSRGRAPRGGREVVVGIPSSAAGQGPATALPAMRRPQGGGLFGVENDPCGSTAARWGGTGPSFGRPHLGHEHVFVLPGRLWRPGARSAPWKPAMQHRPGVLTARLSGHQVMINGNAPYRPSPSRLRFAIGPEPRSIRVERQRGEADLYGGSGVT